MSIPRLCAAAFCAVCCSGARAQLNELTAARERLADRGVAYSLSYIAESFTARGGAQYLRVLATSVTLDLARLHIGRGQIFVSAQAVHGRGINEARVGAIQSPSNLEGREFGKFVEAWYTDAVWEGRLRFKAGRQYADGDFGLAAGGGAFLNSSFGLNPALPLPSYPDPQLGISIWASPLARVSLGWGAFRGGKDAAGRREGALNVAELKLEPFSKPSSQQGAWRAGVWRRSGGARLEDARPAGSYGVYAAAEHWFAGGRGAAERRGPQLFLQWGWAPPDRNEVTQYRGAGAAYEGLAARRPADSAGLAVARVRLAAGSAESVFELFYKIRLNTRVTVEPDMQWIRRPGGRGRNALVGGVRIAVEM